MNNEHILWDTGTALSVPTATALKAAHTLARRQGRRGWHVRAVNGTLRNGNVEVLGEVNGPVATPMRAALGRYRRPRRGSSGNVVGGAGIAA